MPDFLPRRDLDLVNWTQTLGAALSAAPGDYFVSPEAAADYAALQGAFAAAVRRTREADTDCTTATLVKNEARETLLAQTRQLAGALRNNRAIDAALLARVNLARRSRPTRPGKPETAPTLMLSKSGERSVDLTIRDGDALNLAKPPAVTGAELYRFVGDQPPAGAAAWTFIGMASRARSAIALPEGAAIGERVWFRARWVNRRGERGPISEAVFIHAGVVDARPTVAKRMDQSRLAA